MKRRLYHYNDSDIADYIYTEDFTLAATAEQILNDYCSGRFDIDFFSEQDISIDDY